MVVLEGPSGAGKTAAVYACAAELGLKVIEVHSAMPRAGRHVLASFGEALTLTRALALTLTLARALTLALTLTQTRALTRAQTLT